MKKLIKLILFSALALSVNYSCVKTNNTPTPTVGNGNTMSATVNGKAWSASDFGALNYGTGSITAFTGNASDGSGINVQFLQSYTGTVPLNAANSIVVIYISPDNKSYGGTNGSITFTKNTTTSAEGTFNATLAGNPGDTVKITNGKFNIVKMN